jgi:hypothetical protein
LPGNSRPPVFDGPSFARVLKNHMDSKGIEVHELAKAAGTGRGFIQTLRRGRPTDQQMAAGQTVLNPRVNSLAAVAHGLDQRLSFVLSWANFTDTGDRFTRPERELLAGLLDCDPADVDVRLRELAHFPRISPTKE